AFLLRGLRGLCVERDLSPFEWRVKAMKPIHANTTLTLARRLRRLRRSETMRALVRETRLAPDMFVMPLFICEGEGVRREVPSMPGVYNLSVDEAVKEVEGARGEIGRAHV